MANPAAEARAKILTAHPEAAVWQRRRNSIKHRLADAPDGRQRFALDCSIGSMHYGPEWDQEIDTALVPSGEPGWDWEMSRSHWRLLVRNGGWIGIERGGMGFGFRLLGWTFLNIATKEFEAVRNATYPAPAVSDNGLTWAGIYPGVNYKLTIGPDGMGYAISISESARASVPPSPYPPGDTFFVYAYQVKWDDCPYVADAESRAWLDDRDAPFEPRRGLWLTDAAGKVRAWLPVGWAASVTRAEMEPVELKHRYVRRDGTHYLLNGARWDLLKGLPAGDIVLATNVNCGFFER